MKIRLYIRIKAADGSRPFCDPVWARNHQLQPHYATVKGRKEHHPEGTYHLRYLKDGKRVWEPVGSDPLEAARLLHDRERYLRDVQSGISTPEPVVKGRSLAEAISTYLQEVAANKAPNTYTLYERTLRQFGECCQKTTLEAITREDILSFRRMLQAKANCDRTQRTYIKDLQTFLNHYGVKWPLLKTDRIRVVETICSPYSRDEVRGMLSVADVDEADLVHFLLGTGARQQEGLYATWSDIDFARSTYKVTEKRDLGFRPKDREEGIIPLPTSLVQRLLDRRTRHPKTRLIFPFGSRQAGGRQMLDTVKKLAFRAGLNCGECHFKPQKWCKVGACCATSPRCHRFILHKFRKTFATWHHEGGVSARTLQKWLRHSSLDVTLRYLAGSDDASDSIRLKVDSTFAGLEPVMEVVHAA